MSILRKRDSFGARGICAAACAACCVGPLLAVLGGITLAGVTGTFLFGAVSVVAAGLAGGVFLALRRRRHVACPPVSTSVALNAPRRRQAAR